MVETFCMAQTVIFMYNEYVDMYTHPLTRARSLSLSHTHKYPSHPHVMVENA
jgi:hypothetical protein